VRPLGTIASVLETYAPRQDDEVEPPSNHIRWVGYALVVLTLASIVFLFAYSASANAAGGCGGG
jgi:hypothetical protein